mmetsp:Transcript_4637/g.9535  ORF Transcript_4637/g.9535 Transcript_4637/m.9535 type:complete len:339 (+) Transcript_4637:3250-4266(+)
MDAPQLVSHARRLPAPARVPCVLPDQRHSTHGVLLCALPREEVDDAVERPHRLGGLHRARAAPDLFSVHIDHEIASPLRHEPHPVSSPDACTDAEDAPSELLLRGDHRAAIVLRRRQWSRPLHLPFREAQGQAALAPEVEGTIAPDHPGFLCHLVSLHLCLLLVRLHCGEADAEAQVGGGSPHHGHDLDHLNLEEAAHGHHSHGHRRLHEAVALLPPVHHLRVDLRYFPHALHGPLIIVPWSLGVLERRKEVIGLLHRHVVEATVILDEEVWARPIGCDHLVGSGLVLAAQELEDSLRLAQVSMLLQGVELGVHVPAGTSQRVLPIQDPNPGLAEGRR